MKKYKAVFFDRMETAVVSRKAPVGDVADSMESCCSRAKLVIVSGTTVENLAGEIWAVFHRGGTEESLYGAWQRSIPTIGLQGKDKIARLRDSRNQGKTPDT